MPGQSKGTNTLVFIDRSKMPEDRWKDVTYRKIVCNVRPQKAGTNQTRLIFCGSNCTPAIEYGTPTANILTVKLLLDSVVSTPGATFLGLDLKDFYLNKPMDIPEFIRMKLDNFPEDVINENNLMEKVDAKGYVILRVE